MCRPSTNQRRAGKPIPREKGKAEFRAAQSDLETLLLDFGLRVAGARGSGAKRLSISPNLEIDFIGRDEALVYGVNFGVSF